MSQFHFSFKNWKSLSNIPPKTKLLILLLVGLLLLVISLPTKKTSTFGALESEDEKKQVNLSNHSKNFEDTEYEELLETRIENVLSEVEGVGDISVMITLKSSSEEVVDKDITSQSSNSKDNSQTSSTRNAVFVQNSDGSQIPYVKKTFKPKIEGVIVIADGGDNSVVVKNISESIQALFGVEAHKIKIMKRASS